MLEEKLSQLRLNVVLSALKEQRSSAPLDLSFEDRLELLLDREISFRKDKQLRQILLKAKLRYTNASIEEIDFSTSRGIQKSFLLELAQNEWVKKHKNIIVTGPTGVGKTFIACALANSAARDFIPSMYVRFPRLLQELKIAKAQGSYLKALNKLSRLKLLVIDDFCLETPDSISLRDILELFEDRHQVSSTIIATQIPLENWHECLNDPTIADAILDRIVHNAYQIQLKGESMRKTIAKKNNTLTNT